MATAFKNVGVVLNDTATDVYTVPASTTAIIIGCQVANVGASANTLDLWWTDASNANASIYLGDGVSVPAAAAYEPLGGKLVLEAGDKLRGISGTNQELQISVSMVELS